MKSLEIIAAEHGGYIVREAEGMGPDLYRPPLFIGSMAGILQFIREYFEGNSNEVLES